jgi:hypothetical protein
MFIILEGIVPGLLLTTLPRYLRTFAFDGGATGISFFMVYSPILVASFFSLQPSAFSLQVQLVLAFSWFILL